MDTWIEYGDIHCDSNRYEFGARMRRVAKEISKNRTVDTIEGFTVGEPSPRKESSTRGILKYDSCGKFIGVEY